ncbi:uncharacterized protein LOC143028391 [Oratosquilla oratoria]|uniref:uncharacterized protein LOC143028391 n=1 Tax=Oratosquilla oratoria TaxID=337810 RepID=UPI003F76EE3C
MEYNQNGSISSLHLSANNLPIVTGPRKLSPLSPTHSPPLSEASTANHAAFNDLPLNHLHNHHHHNHHHHHHHHHHHVRTPEEVVNRKVLSPDTPPLSTKSEEKDTLIQQKTKRKETYINVESLEEEEEGEDQLTEAWKRKRRRPETVNVPEYLQSAPITRVQHPLEENILLTFLTTLATVALTCLVSIPISLLMVLIMPLAMLVKTVAASCTKESLRGCNDCHIDYLAAHDAQFLLQDVDNNSIMHSVLVIDASMNLKKIKQLVATRVVEAKNGAGNLMYPRFTQRVSRHRGGPAWSPDSSFSLHNHIFAGPSSISTEIDLQKYLSSLLSQPLPTSRPLWEIIVLHDYGRSRDTVMVCRLHQCLSDGMSLLKVLCQSLSDNQIMHIPQKPHFGGTTYGMNLMRAFLVGPLTALTWLWWWKPDLNLLTITHRKLNHYRHHSLLQRRRNDTEEDDEEDDTNSLDSCTAVGARPSSSSSSFCALCRRCCGSGGHKKAKTSKSPGGSKGTKPWRVKQNQGSRAYTVSGDGGGTDNTDSAGHVVVWASQVPVNRVTRIKQVTRTCLNDVLLAALAGALRVTLQRMGIHHPPDLKVNIAVDLRSTTLPFTVPRLGTKAALVPAWLPLQWEADIPRLWEVRARMDDIKASADPVVSYGLVWWALRLLPSSWAQGLLHRLHQRVSLQYSSLPGPTNSLLLGGYTVKHMYNISPARSPTNVSVTVLTYADQVHISVAARRTLPNAARMVRWILREFQKQIFNSPPISHAIPHTIPLFLPQCLQLSDQLANRRIPGEQGRSLVFSLDDLAGAQPLSELQEKLIRVQEELQQVTRQYEAEMQTVTDEQEDDTAERTSETSSGSETSLLGCSSSTTQQPTAAHQHPLRHHLHLNLQPLEDQQQQQSSTSPLCRRHEALTSKVQALKTEFAELLSEIRRRKSLVDGAALPIAPEFEFPHKSRLSPISSLTSQDDEADGVIRRPRKRTLSAVSLRSSVSRELSSCTARPLATPTPTPTNPTPPPIFPSVAPTPATTSRATSTHDFDVEMTSTSDDT